MKSSHGNAIVWHLETQCFTAFRVRLSILTTRGLCEDSKVIWAGASSASQVDRAETGETKKLCGLHTIPTARVF